MLDLKLNLDDIYANGFTATTINPAIAKAALKHSKSLKYNPYEMDSIGHGYAEFSTLDDNWRYPFNLIKDAIIDSCWPIFQYFINDKADLSIEAGIAKAQKGYFVDWHQDCYNQAILSALMIMPDPEDFKPEDGAALQFSQVSRGYSDGVLSRVVTAEFLAKLGSLVVFDLSSLRFQHRCTEMLAKNKTRYFLYMVMGEA